MTKRYLAQHYYSPDNWIFTGNDFEDLEEACFFASKKSEMAQGSVRVLDHDINCVVEEYSKGTRISKGVVPLDRHDSELSKEFYRDLLAVFEKHKDLLRRLAQ